MQDKYTGDVGDFAKYGLLRQLLQASASGRQLSLAVLWYLIDDEASSSDGKHTSYLRDNRIRACDPLLHDALKLLVDTGNRDIASFERSGVLPLGRTVFFSVRLPSSTGRSQKNASVKGVRREWFLQALEASQLADLVFLDPDNGMEVKSVPVSAPRSGKYVYFDEVAALADRGQSLLIYQHQDRTASVEAQVTRTLNKLRSTVPHCASVTAFTFRRGSVRSFFLISSKSHSNTLRASVTTLKHSAWRRYFSVIEG